MKSLKSSALRKSGIIMNIDLNKIKDFYKDKEAVQTDLLNKLISIRQ
jgi:hypothetical protein